MVSGLCLLAVVICLYGCSEKETVPPQEVLDISHSSSREDVKNIIASKPIDTETNKDSGISVENYDKSTFAGHEGQVSFFYDKDGSVLYYKWFVSEKNEKKAKEIYSDVCQVLAGSYGDGEENNSEASGLYTTSFTNDKQQITAQLQKSADGSGYEVSYMVVG